MQNNKKEISDNNSIAKSSSKEERGLGIAIFFIVLLGILNLILGGPETARMMYYIMRSSCLP